MSGSPKFWEGPTYRIVKAMKATGNQPGIVARWKAMVEEWANKEPLGDPDKAAARAWLPLWQPRPFYTAAELAPLFPVLAVALRFTDRPPPQMSPARLANALKYARLPHFMRNGVLYFVVEQCHLAEEFENAQS